MNSIIDCIVALLLCAPLIGQAMLVIRGEVTALRGTAGAGEIEIGAKLCRFDARTVFERERMTISSTAVAAGDRIEMIADREGEGCYARTVEVEPRAYTITDSLIPAGEFTFAGLVTEKSDFALILRTKSGNLRVFVRPDTRFIDNGVPSDARGVLNQHVFVRGGRNGEGALEAYQVIWGEIIGASPDPR